MATLPRNPIARGSLLAIGAALLFGITTPAVKHFGANVGAFATAALLYAGAAVGAGLLRRRTDEAGVTRRHVLRIVSVATFGAVLAPTAFAWGLQRSGALATSLLLNLESVFTVFLAHQVYRERIGKRVTVACGLMLCGGALLTLRIHDAGSSSVLGLSAIGCATVFWALDNTFTRSLADLEPTSVVFWKASTGAAGSTVLAVLMNDAWPRELASAALLACGAAGYGLSLRLYLEAQRTLGAARTGSLFALGPFVGAAVSFALGDRAGAPLILAAALVFACAAYLHVTETHRHRHLHEPLDHEHPHTHDDGHHTHLHLPAVVGSHSHAHQHQQVEHDHPHGADVHHRHGHD
jgi:drug/metabolite transporter (DMT)-like permease